MEASEYVEHIIIALLLSPITIISLIVVYQLFAHLCCVSNDANEQVDSPSISNTDASKSDIQPPATKSTGAGQIHSFFRYTTVISCALFCVVVILIMIHRIVVILNTGTSTTMFAVGVYTFWYIGRMILTLIFIGTLYFAFRGSMFAYSRATMLTLFICWITMPLFAISSLFFWAVSTPLMIICTVLFVLVDIVLSFVLLYLYLKQLFHLISGDHKIFISVFVRYTLLYSICFTSSVTVFILFGLTPVFKNDENTDYGKILFFFISIDSFINMLCLWLRLKIAQKWYLRLCNFSHKKMVICCNSCSKYPHDESMIIVEIEQQQKEQKQQTKKQPEKQNIEENIQTSKQQTEDQIDDTITVQTETKNTAIIL